MCLIFNTHSWITKCIYKDLACCAVLTSLRDRRKAKKMISLRVLLLGCAVALVVGSQRVSALTCSEIMTPNDCENVYVDNTGCRWAYSQGASATCVPGYCNDQPNGGPNCGPGKDCIFDTGLATCIFNPPPPPAPACSTLTSDVSCMDAVAGAANNNAGCKWLYSGTDHTCQEGSCSIAGAAGLTACEAIQDCLWDGNNGACYNSLNTITPPPPAPVSSSSGAAAPAAFVGSARCYSKTTSDDCRLYVITRCYVFHRCCVSSLLCFIAVVFHRCFLIAAFLSLLSYRC